VVRGEGFKLEEGVCGKGVLEGGLPLEAGVIRE
jgi:hypothetical protein